MQRVARAQTGARHRLARSRRKSDWFKRSTSWPAYATLDRHNLFRFYDWGCVKKPPTRRLALLKNLLREIIFVTDFCNLLQLGFQPVDVAFFVY